MIYWKRIKSEIFFFEQLPPLAPIILSTRNAVAVNCSVAPGPMWRVVRKPLVSMAASVPREWFWTRGNVSTQSSVHVSMETRCFRLGPSSPRTAINGQCQSWSCDFTANIAAIFYLPFLNLLMF